MCPVSPTCLPAWSGGTVLELISGEKRALSCGLEDAKLLVGRAALRQREPEVLQNDTDIVTAP